MTLTYPQLVAIGAVLSARGTTFQHLLKAVDKELIEARKDHETCPAAPQEERRVEGDG